PDDGADAADEPDPVADARVHRHVRGPHDAADPTAERREGGADGGGPRRGHAQPVAREVEVRTLLPGRLRCGTGAVPALRLTVGVGAGPRLLGVRLLRIGACGLVAPGRIGGHGHLPSGLGNMVAGGAPAERPIDLSTTRLSAGVRLTPRLSAVLV